ncbi:MAG: alpha-amylase, partial [Desulfobacter sp.]|nr:alpha-amylase [Desulfobacter sp.]
VRFNIKTRKSVLVVGNFDAHPQHLNLFELETQGFQMGEHIRDLYSGNTPTLFKDQLVLPPYRFYWLAGN